MTLTDFLILCLKTDRATLARASPEKMAERWGLPFETVRFNLEWSVRR